MNGKWLGVYLSAYNLLIENMANKEKRITIIYGQAKKYK